MPEAGGRSRIHFARWNGGWGDGGLRARASQPVIQFAAEVASPMPTKPSTRPRHSISAGVLCILLFAACAVEVRSPEPEAVFAMEKEFLNLPHLAKPSGYTHVVTSPPGKMIFLSGQGGADEKGELPKDFRTQCDNTFKNIQKALEMAGGWFR